MQLTQVIQLRNDFELITKDYNMPEGSAIDTIEWFLENGHRSNSLRNGFKDAQEIAKKIRTGQVILNRISRGDYPAPFGGFKMSGNGREHGLFGIDEYLEVQAVIT